MFTMVVMSFKFENLNFIHLLTQSMIVDNNQTFHMIVKVKLSTMLSYLWWLK